jgi:carbamoyl-phosphate synthase small subunit
MNKTAYLVLADGTAYRGFAFGADTDTIGEVVFNTSMAGYQEMLTDPSYAGQILMPTYPLIGNYGTNLIDDESRKIQVKGFVVREECLKPSHYQNVNTLHDYLAAQGIPGIRGIDTRAVTRRLRSAGVMMGAITTGDPAAAVAAIKSAPNYGDIDFVHEVTSREPYTFGLPCGECRFRTGCFTNEHPVPPVCGLNPDPRQNDLAELPYHVVVLDCGLKYNILRLLNRHGCRVTVMPCTSPAEEILKLAPDGVLLSPGPGDPDLPKVNYIVETVQKLVGRQPIMGICFGNQLINRAFGGRHFKLKFGHRGGNHPVKEVETGLVHITAQNHGYAVDPESVGKELMITHFNLNDGTVEGLRHRELPIFSIQYHSEASPGPLDNVHQFRMFVESIKRSKET